MNSPSSGWTQGNLTNAQALFATLVIPTPGIWLISFSVVITSTAVTTGQVILTSAYFANLGLTNGTNQATFVGAVGANNGMTMQGSIAANISGTINAYTTFTGGNAVTCLYTYSYLQATRIA